MCNRVYPDFRRRAEVLIEEHEEKLSRSLQNHSFVPGSEVLIEEIAALLKEEHEKGWSAGYIDAQEHGWEDALEADTAYQQLHSGRGTTPHDFEKED